MIFNSQSDPGICEGNIFLILTKAIRILINSLIPNFLYYIKIMEFKVEIIVFEIRINERIFSDLIAQY